MVNKLLIHKLVIINLSYLLMQFTQALNLILKNSENLTETTTLHASYTHKYQNHIAVMVTKLYAQMISLVNQCNNIMAEMQSTVLLNICLKKSNTSGKL